jgi:tetraacyldisaccharide 4'-kinase
VNGERFRNARLVAFAGIGRPEKFFAMLRRLGGQLVATHAFGDHHPYRGKDIAGLRETAARGNAQLVTTAKDWVRLDPESRARIEALEIEVRWRDPVMLHRVLDPFLPQAGDGRDARAARG